MAKIKDEVFDLCYTPEEGEIVELSRDADGTVYYSQQHAQPFYNRNSDLSSTGGREAQEIVGDPVVRGGHNGHSRGGGQVGHGGRGSRGAHGGHVARGRRGGRSGRGRRGGRYLRGVDNNHDRKRGGQQGRCNRHHRRNCTQCISPPVHVRANSILEEIAKLIEELNGTRPTANQIRSMINAANF